MAVLIIQNANIPLTTKENLYKKGDIMRRTQIFGQI